MERKTKKMKKGTKTALIVIATVICSIFLMLLIAFMPGIDTDKDIIGGTDEKTDIEVTDKDYNDMSKSELVKLIEERDEEIRLLKEQAALYSDSVDVNIGIPIGGSSADSKSDSSNKKDDEDDEKEKPSGNSSKEEDDKKPSSGSDSSSEKNDSSSGNSAKDDTSSKDTEKDTDSKTENPNLSDSGL